MTQLAQLTEELHGSIAVARVRGEIDASNATWLDQRLRALVTNQCEGLAVDLSDTTYVDSAGIALMFGLSTALRQHQQQLRLVVADGSPIARMTRLTGLAEAVPVHPTLESALAAS